MGYYTKYSLEIRHPGDYSLLQEEYVLRFIISDLRRFYEDARYSLTEMGEFKGEESKWYAHEYNLKDFSRRYPAFLLVLSGEGEGRGGAPDLWRKYFLNGKCQAEKVTWGFAPFDENLLK